MSRFNVNFSNWGPVTTVLAILVIIAVVGGIVCAAVGDAAFHRFVSLADALWKYAIALAGLGIGRGIHLGLSSVVGDGPGDPVAPQAAGYSGPASVPQDQGQGPDVLGR